MDLHWVNNKELKRRVVFHCSSNRSEMSKSGSRHTDGCFLLCWYVSLHLSYSQQGCEKDVSGEARTHLPPPSIPPSLQEWKILHDGSGTISRSWEERGSTRQHRKNDPVFVAIWIVGLITDYILGELFLKDWYTWDHMTHKPACFRFLPCAHRVKALSFFFKKSCEINFRSLGNNFALEVLLQKCIFLSTIWSRISFCLHVWYNKVRLQEGLNAILRRL